MREGQVLLQRRRNTGYLDRMWVAGAAGHIEFGETATAAAVREASEELGVRLDPADLRAVTIMQRTDGTANPAEQRADWFFTATDWSGEPRVMEPHKCDAVAWFPLADLPDAIPAYERLVLEGIASHTLSPFSSFGF